MKIDKKTILKIAKLSKIKLKENEIEEFANNLSSILDWVEQLNETDTDNIEPLNNVSSSKLPLREDKTVSNNSSNQVLNNAPEKVEEYFIVPKVVE
ncbi:MAG: Glutamyl-tRNA(Gln) amidotransferase subunit C [Alphaproteobacteria bacterium MarineAlpha5_Bin12]|nr:MAG: Glutamyl-tRNA(Gln) amidotransferase subunit C [Alphaproteobacteria bacterium MarineAlpha5_Bin12]|tara:strand:- start:5090 stop:5377 length:288 start_codon:yes stop_codon:yes gene_type:complete